MRTSRKESSEAGRVYSEAEKECGQTPAMEEGTGVKPGSTPGYSVLHSPSLHSLVGEECLQMLRCSLCTEFFNIPIVLPCGHTFCLQCLTDMCKQATQSCGQGANPVGAEALIGCPNCHVQIFATPILQRNVTCNFIIQSLIDTLRNRKLPVRTHVSVNTERSLLGPPVRAVSEEALCGVLQDLDRLSTFIHHTSVVDDAFFEIEQIRSTHLQDLDKTSGEKPHEKADALRSTHTQSQGVEVPPHFTPPVTPSSATPRMTFVQPQTASVKRSPQNSLKRCYAAALTSGRDRSAAGPPTASTAPDLKARGPVPSYCCKALPTLPSNASASQIALFTHFGRSSHPASQNRNRNNPGLAPGNGDPHTALGNKQTHPCLLSNCVSGQKGWLSSSTRVNNNSKVKGKQEWESRHQLASLTTGLQGQTQNLGCRVHSIKVRKFLEQSVMFH